MRIIRFTDDKADNIFSGTDYNGEIARILKGDIYTGFEKTDEFIKVNKILPPINPSVIFCIGLNYRRHALETGFDLPNYPVLFMKNPAAVQAHMEPVVIPWICSQKPEVDYEAELGVIIGKIAKNISPQEGLDYVLGYVCANDISARRWQKNAGGGQWIRGKSFDTFCPFGPELVTRDEIPDPQNLSIQCRVNGQVMQNSRTEDMIFSVAEIISYLSQSTTLLPGTLILTGTPEGVGYTRQPPVYLMPGDILETYIENLGILRNPVVCESR